MNWTTEWEPAITLINYQRKVILSTEILYRNVKEKLTFLLRYFIEM